ncbi:MAG: type III pantothenate kinase [Dysgonamonadaceae bacterium]|nr:type III pantothenate kinase [Dysgonamonadaceae bacterium]
MNIVIDQGNTSAKVAFFYGYKLFASFIFKPLTADKLRKLLNKFSPSYGILCSVAEINPEVTELLESSLLKFYVLDHTLKLPVQIDYKTPQTLGKDRLSAVVGAWRDHKDKNILVIDSGTAITYDFLDASNVYRGGNISPGMTIRFKALNKYTKHLPMLDEKGDLPKLGYDTETAIRAGVVGGIIKEMDAYINEYKEQFPDLLVFLTGGHSFYFETKLKNSTFANGNLVLTGLNEILNYQNEN